MTRLAKPRSKSLPAEIRRVGYSVNDNVPGALPGHELSDLDDVPAQSVVDAATESGVSQIDRFPVHPAQALPAITEAPAMDATPERQSRIVAAGGKRVTFACFGSFLFHAAVFGALTATIVAAPQDPIEEAGAAVSVVMLGDADMDQTAAGDETEQKEPEPEAVVAEAVQPETLQPADAEPAEVQPAQPQPAETQPAEMAQAEPAQPIQPLQAVSPETVVAAEPEVLTSAVPAEPTVVQPMATEVADVAPPTEMQPSPAEVQPVEAPEPVAEAQPEPPETVVVPEKKPAAARPVEKPKYIVRKTPPKKVEVKSGSSGDNTEDHKRGSSEGVETAQSDRSSQGAARSSGAGSAAVANYPGKVQSRIRRSVRVPSEYRRMSEAMTVRVRLTVGASGDLSSLSVARSSGIPDLDKAVVDGVRRAAPFPPLPPEWGMPSWSFTQEVQVTGR